VTKNRDKIQIEINEIQFTDKTQLLENEGRKQVKIKDEEETKKTRKEFKRERNIKNVR